MTWQDFFSVSILDHRHTYRWLIWVFFKGKQENIPETVNYSHSFFFSFNIWTPHCVYALSLSLSLSFPLALSYTLSDSSGLGDPPPCPGWVPGSKGEGWRLRYLECEICSVHSSVWEWKMGLYPVVCLNPLTRGKETLSLWFFWGWCLIRSLKSALQNIWGIQLAGEQSKRALTAAGAALWGWNSNILMI